MNLGDLKREVEIIKKNQMKILHLKNIIINKNSLDELNNRLEKAELASKS